MTITPIHPMILGFFYEWQDFKNNLPDELKQDFENLMIHANQHLQLDSRGILFQQVIMSILIEQEKEIKRFRDKLIPNISYNFTKQDI